MRPGDLFSSPRGLDAACAAALVIITGLAYAAGVHPALQRRSEIDALRSQLQAARDETRELAQTVQSLGQEHQRLDNEQTRSQVTLSGPDQRTRVLRDVTALLESARGLGMRIGSIDAGETAPAGRYLVTPIAITGSAPPSVVRRVLVDLRKALPDVGVRKLILSRSADAGLEAGEFSVELTWFAAAGGKAVSTYGPASDIADRAVSGVRSGDADR